MAFYKDPTLDPYLQGDKAGASDSDSETEAMTLQKNDLLIMAARNEDDVSHLEVRAGSQGRIADGDAASTAHALVSRGRKAPVATVPSPTPLPARCGFTRSPTPGAPPTCTCTIPSCCRPFH